MICPYCKHESSGEAICPNCKAELPKPAKAAKAETAGNDKESKKRKDEH